MVSAGDLRERVQIQSQGTTDQDGGLYSETWSEVDTVSASVLPIRGEEALIAMQLQRRQSYKVTIRFRTDVTTDHRLLWRSQPLEIQSFADPTGRRQWLEIVAEQVSDATV